MIDIKRKVSLLDKIIGSLWKRLENCKLCPRQCGANRLRGKRGFCGAGKELVVYTAFCHSGEEPAISGEKGSGTIFFSGCNLKCIYCQNYKFSHTLYGREISVRQLAKIMLNLEEDGAHNINLVTPTHFLPHILKAIRQALEKGLSIPLVYNTSGFENIDTLRILDGIIDVYLTDIRYFDPDTANKLSSARGYPEINQKAIMEMHAQKKHACLSGGLMIKGIIIRHLILPGGTEESKNAIRWIKKHAPLAYLSIMAQYQPYYKASKYPGINRTLTKPEYLAIKEFVEKIDIENGWIQEFIPKKELAGVYFKPSLLERYL